jgi:hypothetical protein
MICFVELADGEKKKKKKERECQAEPRRDAVVNVCRTRQKDSSNRNR